MIKSGRMGKFLAVTALVCLALTTVEGYSPELIPQKVNHVSIAAPRLHHIPNFASDEEMDHIMKQSFEKMR